MAQHLRRFQGETCRRVDRQRRIWLRAVGKQDRSRRRHQSLDERAVDDGVGTRQNERLLLIGQVGLVDNPSDPCTGEAAPQPLGRALEPDPQCAVADHADAGRHGVFAGRGRFAAGQLWMSVSGHVISIGCDLRGRGWS